MNNIEIIVGLLLLFMAVPDVCRRLAKPGLVFPAFVLLGMVIGPLSNPEVQTMLNQAGAIGFLLLLFQVGLEIDLPRFKELLQPLRFALPWAALQYPPLLLLGTLAGLSVSEAFVASAALTGVSVGMAYPVLKNYEALSPSEKHKLLQIFVVLETMAIVLLAVEAPALKSGLTWFALLRLLGIATVVFLVARFSQQVTRLFHLILEQGTHWRTHLLVLLILAVCAVGERLGLAAAKTAFFLGLFMSRAEHEGKPLDDYIAPVSQRFLIPIFFVSLGMRVEWSQACSWAGLTAFGTAGLVLGIREVMHRRWLPVARAQHAFLLLCPNLTITALGAASLHSNGASPDSSGWLLLTGLFVTVMATLVASPSARYSQPDLPSDLPSELPSESSAQAKPAAVQI